MAETITMPKLGFDMAEGTLVRWVKNVGESINKGEILAEIETDKATVTVESSAQGTILKQLVNEGDVVPINSPIAIVGTEGEKVEEAAPTDEQKPEAAEKPEKTVETTPTSEKNIKTSVSGVSNAAEGMTKAMPKEDRAPTAEAIGTLKAEKQEARDMHGEVIGKETPAAESQEGEEDLLRASPLAKRLAREKGLDLRNIEGTGPGGRITRKDVEAAGTTEKARPTPTIEKSEPVKVAEKTMPLPAALLQSQTVPEDQKIPLNRLRGAIGRRMLESKHTIPHFYVTHEYDMQALMNLRTDVNGLLQEDQRISVNDFIVKATALALRQYPNLNAAIEENEVIRYGHVNIGVAVAVEGGLLTVVCKDADQKPLRMISKEVREMAGRARKGKVSPSDIEGSTFSLSNLGMYDVDEFIAIVNPPEAAILAIGSARQVPVVQDGEVRPGWRMKMTISADHRITDGAEAAQFMQTLAEYIEKPMVLFV